MPGWALTVSGEVAGAPFQTRAAIFGMDMDMEMEMEIEKDPTKEIRVEIVPGARGHAPGPCHPSSVTGLGAQHDGHDGGGGAAVLCSVRLLLLVVGVMALAPALAAPAPVAAPPPEAGQRAREVHGLLRAGKVDEAAASGEALVREFPSCGPCQVAAGAAYGAKAQKSSVFTQLSWAKKCRAAFSKAVELEPTSLEARFSLLQFDVNAPGIAGGGLDRGRADAEAIAKLSPSAGRVASGMVKEKEKDLPGAEKEYRAAVSAEPVDPRALRTLASFLQRQKRAEEAFEALRAFLVRHPGDASALYQVGRLSALTGTNAEEGLVSLDAFLKVPVDENLPSAADAWYRKGQILVRQGRKADAKTAFERSLKEFPGHAGATEELAKL